MFERAANRLRRALALIKKRGTSSTSPQQDTQEDHTTGRLRRVFVLLRRRQKDSDVPPSQEDDTTPGPHHQDEPSDTTEQQQEDEPPFIDFEHPDRGMPDHIDRSQPSVIEGNPSIIDTNSYSKHFTTYSILRRYIDTSPLKHAKEYYAVLYEPGPQHTAYGAHWYFYVEK